jgi:hypothetical protein
MRVNWVNTDLWHPNNNSDRSLKAESAQMCYLFEGMTWDVGPFSSEKGKGGVKGAVEWAQKKTRLQKREDGAHGSATKKTETYCYSEIFFFLNFWLTLKLAE